VLSSRAWRAFTEQAGAMQAAATSASLGEFAATAIERAHRKALKRARGIDWRDASDRHAFRVRLKRLRYTCDFLAPSFAARPAAGYLESLKRLQDILGELNDLRVGRALLSGMKGPARAVNRSLAVREAALLRRLAPAWRALESRAPFWRPGGRRPRRAAT
jgi:CHAD domain-containing protein